MLHPFMPFVTEEIYQMLPFKTHDSIMIANYPKYDKQLVFTSETKEIEKVIEFIALFRNKKAENNVTSEFEVITDIDNELILRMLKLTDKCVKLSKYNGTLEVKFKDYKLVICYDNSEQLVIELENLKKEKESLENSIQRRKKLLANENYVAKAPENIVNQEKENLSIEEDKLKAVLKRLNELS